MARLDKVALHSLQVDQLQSIVLLQMAPKIKGRMMATGTTMVGYQPDQFTHRPNFFRLIISNQAIQESDLDFLIEQIAKLAADL